MARKDIDKKMQLLLFLPYGFCSKYTTILAGKSNREAARFLLGDNQEAQIALCDLHRQRTLYQARGLIQEGYVQETQRACGTPPQKRPFRHLSKAGLNFLLESSDGMILASEDPAAFDESLLDAVIEGKVTPLSYAIDLIDSAKINLDKYSQNQIYTIWRLSHITAMFMINGFLTCLDRRPFDIGFAIDGITDEESFNLYVEKYGYTIAAITYYALTRWYNKHPGFYQITDTVPDLTKEGKQDWLETPAFYSTRELPSANSYGSATTDANAKGSKQTMKAIYVGLATGRNANYACYHAKQGPVTWNQKREKQAKEALECAIAEMKKQNPEIPYRDTVDFALYFCTSIHQFLRLFDLTKKRHVKNKEQNLPIAKPYASVHVLPVNDSGGFLLWALLEHSPLTMEQLIHQNLVDSESGFQFNGPNLIFPLTFGGKWVFSGYTMDIRKINRALEKYLDGFIFYIACLPDQMSWYRQLFPGLPFI